MFDIRLVCLLVCICVDLPLSSMTSTPLALIPTPFKMPLTKGGGKDVECSEEMV